MNGKSRYLPRLNLCYLQKKAYEIHLKKMSTIQHRSIQALRVNTDLDSHERRLGSITGNRMQTVQEKSLKTVIKLSPYRKKVLQQTERENVRLFQAIQKCPSTISRKVISQHTYLSQQFKGRIQKFAVQPGSKKTLLKCQISLDKMNKKERYGRLYTFTADQKQKVSSRVRKQVRTQSSQRRQFFNSLQQSNPNNQSRGLMISRNKNKINNHFERSEISLRTRQKLQGFRQNMENSKKMHSSQIYKWKTRCFTTQMQSHSKQQSQ